MAYTSYQYNPSLPTKGSGMDPVTASALISGGTQLVGGALNGKGNKRAVETQDAAARRAEAIAIDNEKRRREEYDRAEALQKAQHDAEQARRAPYEAAKNALLQQNAGRMGLSLGEMGRGAPMSYATSSKGTPRTLASLAGSGYIPPEAMLTPSQDKTLGRIFDWAREV